METPKYIKFILKALTIGLIALFIAGCTPKACPTYANADIEVSENGTTV